MTYWGMEYFGGRVVWYSYRGHGIVLGYGLEGMMGDGIIGMCGEEIVMGYWIV